MSDRALRLVQRSSLVSSLAVCLLATPVSAGDLYIVNGEVHTLTGPPVMATVVVQGESIVAVDPGATPGPDDETIDATGMVITPGLVDFTSTLGLVEIWAVGHTRDTDGGGDEIRAGFRAVDGLNPQSTLVAVARIEGVTSVVSHPSGGLISGQSVWWDLVGEDALDGVALAPATMDFLLGAPASRTTGSRGATLLRYRELFADVRAYLADPRGFQTGNMRDLSLSLVDMEALAGVLDADVPVLVQANRRTDILAALSLADEYGLRIIISGGAEAWAAADELAAAGVPVVVNPLHNAPYDFDRLGTRGDAAALLDSAGVQVILTTSEAHRVGTLRQAAGNAVREGMAHDSALAAITLRPAQAAGLDTLYGTIEPGKVANLVVWSGDPLELSTRARHVMIRGQSIPLVSRQTRLFDRYRELPSGLGGTSEVEP